MRLATLLLLAFTTTTPALASNWFSSDEEPKPWTEEQLEKAQAVYQNVKDSTFDTWTESQLRQFLVDQGIAEPNGNREQLAQMARNQRKAFSSAASSYSASASTPIYKDSHHQATQTISSLASQATKYIQDTFDETRDYVYSTWSDNQLRTWLEEHGYIRTQSQATREDMLEKMKESYASTTDPIYASWSDSYMRRWLIEHGIMDEPPTQREKLMDAMNQYYFDTEDYVWSSWNDSQLHQWLVEYNIIKPDAEIKHDKMLKLVQDNYLSATNAVWDAWTESEIRAWLIEHGYLRTEAQVKRDELVKLINSKYNDTANRSAEYLTWPDARLRAYLRMHGIPESQIPATRPGLLHEVRVRYVIAQNHIDALMQKIRDAVYGSIENAEEKLNAILSTLAGAKEDVKTYGTEKKRDAYAAAEEASASAEAKMEESRKEATKLKQEL